jgi:hypothetical protein
MMQLVKDQANVFLNSANSWNEQNKKMSINFLV